MKYKIIILSLLSLFLVGCTGETVIIPDQINVKLPFANITGNVSIGGNLYVYDSIWLQNSVFSLIDNTTIINNVVNLNTTEIYADRINITNRLTINYSQGIYSSYSTGAYSQFAYVGTGNAGNTSGISNINIFGSSLNGVQLGSATGGLFISNVNPKGMSLIVNNTNVMRVDNNGFIGLGIAPTVRLHVNGALTIVGALSGVTTGTYSSTQTITVSSTNNTATITGLTLNPSSATVNNLQGSPMFSLATSIWNTTISTSHRHDFYTTGENSTKQINLILRYRTNRQLNSTLINITSNIWQNMTNEIILNGNVGIGTKPTSKLNIYDSSTLSDIRFHDINTVSGNGGLIAIKSTYNINPTIYINATGTADVIRIDDSGTNVLTLKDGGNIGIGTTSPTSKLHVIGDLNVTGNFALGGNMSAKRPYAVFSSTENQVITSANTAYNISFNWTEDNYLININSNRTGFTFQQKGDYLIELSAIADVDTANKHFEIWLEKNGVAVPRSNTRIALTSALEETLIVVPLIIDVQTTDILAFKMASDDAGSRLIYTTNSSYSPESPSIIVTMTKISDLT